MKKKHLTRNHPLMTATFSADDLEEAKTRAYEGHEKAAGQILNSQLRQSDKARAAALMLTRSWQLEIAPPLSLVRLLNELLYYHHKKSHQYPVKKESQECWGLATKFEASEPIDPRGKNPSTASVMSVACKAFVKKDEEIWKLKDEETKKKDSEKKEKDGNNEKVLKWDNHRKTIRKWRKLPQYVLDVEYWRALGSKDQDATKLFVDLHLKRLNAIIDSAKN